MRDLQTGEKYTFLAGRWLAIDKEDGLIDCVLPLATKSELQHFSYMFESKAMHDLKDTHTWLSVIGRSPKSSFTRCQRLSVAVSLLLCSMTASAMFYGAMPPTTAANENKIGAFSFTWFQVNLVYRQLLENFQPNLYCNLC